MVEWEELHQNVCNCTNDNISIDHQCHLYDMFYIIPKNIAYADGEIIGFNYNALEKRYD